MKNEDQEVKSIGIISEALAALEDSDARKRVLEWAWTKYVGGVPSQQPPRVPGSNKPSNPPGSFISSQGGEIPGVACLTPESELKITARDLKAKSTIDAAIRLAHIVILANEILTGEKSVSSKKVLLPVLREWRAYDGNTRNALARHKGIIRSGDNLSLDAHSRTDAEDFIKEVLNVDLQGTWKPSGNGRKRSGKAVGDSKKGK